MKVTAAAVPLKWNGYESGTPSLSESTVMSASSKIPTNGCSAPFKLKLTVSASLRPVARPRSQRLRAGATTAYLSLDFNTLAYVILEFTHFAYR